MINSGCPSAESGCRGGRKNATQNGGTTPNISALTGDDTPTRGQTVNTAELQVESESGREARERIGTTYDKEKRQHENRKNKKERRNQKDKLIQTELTGDDTIARGQTVCIKRRRIYSNGCRYINVGEDTNRLVGIREDDDGEQGLNSAVDLGTECLFQNVPF